MRAELTASNVNVCICVSTYVVVVAAAVRNKNVDEMDHSQSLTQFATLTIRTVCLTYYSVVVFFCYYCLRSIVH